MLASLCQLERRQTWIWVLVMLVLSCIAFGWLFALVGLYFLSWNSRQLIACLGELLYELQKEWLIGETISCTTRYPINNRYYFYHRFFLPSALLLFPISLFQIEESVSLASKIWAGASGQKEGKQEKVARCRCVCVSVCNVCYVHSVTCGNTVLFGVCVRRMKREMHGTEMSLPSAGIPVLFVNLRGPGTSAQTLPQRVIIYFLGFHFQSGGNKYLWFVPCWGININGS